jgi:hypothetical protein
MSERTANSLISRGICLGWCDILMVVEQSDGMNV